MQKNTNELEMPNKDYKKQEIFAIDKCCKNVYSKQKREENAADVYLILPLGGKRPRFVMCKTISK